MEEALAAAGFDLVLRFDARAVAREVGFALLDDPDRAVGVLIGNTRALWPPFVAARAADPALDASPDPLDRYTEQSIGRVADRAFYVHRRYAGGFVPMQRIAVAAGLGTLSKTHFVIHPVFGPWFALRAIALVDGTPPPRQIAPRACSCDARCEGALAAALSSTGPDRSVAWLAVRDACPVGREHRYSDAQIEHHYAHMSRMR